MFVISSQTRYIVPVPSTASSNPNGNSINDNSHSIYASGPNAVGINANTSINSIQERLNALETEKNKKIDALDNK